MRETLLAQIIALKSASVEELQHKHKELFNASTELSINPERSRRVNGQGAISDNKVYLIRRIAYRLQKSNVVVYPKRLKVG